MKPKKRKQVVVGWVPRNAANILGLSEGGGVERWMEYRFHECVTIPRGQKKDWANPSMWPPQKVRITVEYL